MTNNISEILITIAGMILIYLLYTTDNPKNKYRKKSRNSLRIVIIILMIVAAYLEGVFYFNF